MNYNKSNLYKPKYSATFAFVLFILSMLTILKNLIYTVLLSDITEPNQAGLVGVGQLLIKGVYKY